jgi:uncharacterized Tic20 family protein
MNSTPKDNTDNQVKSENSVSNDNKFVEFEDDKAAIIAACVHLCGWFLFLIPSLVTFLVFKNELIKSHAKEAMNLQINFMLYGLIYVLGFVFLIPIFFIDPTGLFTSLTILGATLFIYILSIVFVVYPIIGAVKAASKAKYRFPFVVRFIK